MTVATSISPLRARRRTQQRDERGPDGEDVDVQDRDPEDDGGSREQGEQRIVEEQRAEQEQRDQPLSLEPAHQVRLTP
jgi:hypothetical protein